MLLASRRGSFTQRPDCASLTIDGPLAVDLRRRGDIFLDFISSHHADLTVNIAEECFEACVENQIASGVALVGCHVSLLAINSPQFASGGVSTSHYDVESDEGDGDESESNDSELVQPLVVSVDSISRGIFSDSNNAFNFITDLDLSSMHLDSLDGIASLITSLTKLRRLSLLPFTQNELVVDSWHFSLLCGALARFAFPLERFRITLTRYAVAHFSVTEKLSSFMREYNNVSVKKRSIPPGHRVPLVQTLEIQSLGVDLDMPMAAAIEEAMTSSEGIFSEMNGCAVRIGFERITCVRGLEVFTRFSSNCPLVATVEERMFALHELQTLEEFLRQPHSVKMERIYLDGSFSKTSTRLLLSLVRTYPARLGTGSFALDFGFVNLGPSDGEAVAKFIVNAPVLKFLYLEENSLSDRGLGAIARVLPRCHKLKQLYLCGNDAGERGVEELISVLPQCCALETVKVLSQLAVRPEVTERLLKVAQTCNINVK